MSSEEDILHARLKNEINRGKENPVELGRSMGEVMLWF